MERRQACASVSGGPRLKRRSPVLARERLTTSYDAISYATTLLSSSERREMCGIREGDLEDLEGRGAYRSLGACSVSVPAE